MNAVFASSSLFLTVSSLGVITAWRINVSGAGYRRGDVTMQREATLRGHSRPVTCLAANTSWSILVSGAEVSGSGGTDQFTDIEARRTGMLWYGIQIVCDISGLCRRGKRSLLNIALSTKLM